MPVAVVRAAAAASTGLHYYDQAPAERERPGDPDRELLIASIDELTPEDRHDGARPGSRRWPTPARGRPFRHARGMLLSSWPIMTGSS